MKYCGIHLLCFAIDEIVPGQGPAVLYVHIKCSICHHKEDPASPHFCLIHPPTAFHIASRLLYPSSLLLKCDEAGMLMEA